MKTYKLKCTGVKGYLNIHTMYISSLKANVNGEMQNTLISTDILFFDRHFVCTSTPVGHMHVITQDGTEHVE